MIVDILTPAVLAAGFRLRGAAKFREWVGRGATTARLLTWAVPVGILSWMLGLPIVTALALGAAAFIGCLLGWWESLDLGRHEGTWLRDFTMHSLRGVLWTAPMAAVLLVADLFPGAGATLWGFDLQLGASNAWWWMAGSGALCGLAYEVGYQIKEDRGTEIGEGIFGGLIGLALALALAMT